ncbi:3',5'-cyclic adenosine monophosphate phosphodiesterase CpdA [Salipiger pallidus]|uniref:3',5'-cyclic adenosine monophosphate phosphodiesterase CpdA n=1 Tax=Salipiger pallidus TaxID=1775170 RepID=A0A8J2ZM67_9RHOB|nr:phosphodiesterase [Salipiger pallidus]GGG79525.1 3',5'-cyclic adenosine monophosphate phosphodiesterase CpdA [Salipiger pallidus]
MKFIHLTDTHVIGGDRTLYGGDPAQRLGLAVDSINREHSDAAFTVVTGDLTHWGDADAYAAFEAQISRLAMPLVLMVGNHDVTEAFSATFPDAPRDEAGFVQSTRQTPQGTCLFLDTHQPGTHAGHYCATRRAWLARQLNQTSGPLLMFMHHPPFATGIAAMDAIMMQDHAVFWDVIEPHKHRIRHLFFGHVHRAMWGNWRGISWSCMRGLNHQVALDLTPGMTSIPGDLGAPAYGVALVDEDCVTVHLHEFASTAPRFTLDAPDGGDSAAYALSMQHDGYAFP